jgi:hypothetical protein
MPAVGEFSPTPTSSERVGTDSGVTSADSADGVVKTEQGEERTAANNTFTENFTDRDDLKKVDADWVDKKAYRLWGHYQFDDKYDKDALSIWSSGYDGDMLQYRPKESGWYFNVPERGKVEAYIDPWNDRFGDELGPKFELIVDYRGEDSCRALTQRGFWEDEDARFGIDEIIHFITVNDGRYEIRNDSKYWDGSKWTSGLGSVSGDAQEVRFETVIGRNKYVIWGSFKTVGDSPSFKPREDDKRLDYIYYWFYGPDRYEGCTAETNSGYIDELNTPYDRNGTITSTNINPTDGVVDTAKLSATAERTPNSHIEYYMSADGGSHWERVEAGEYHQFDHTGSDLRWKAVLKRDRWSSAETPVLKNLSVTVDTPPEANAGDDKTIIVGDTVPFDARNSTDDRGIETYEWDIDEDGTYERSGSTTAVTIETSGTHQIDLRVTDAAGHTATDTVNVTAAENKPPQADAGENETVDVGTTASLSAENSSDENGHALSYEWTLLTHPNGSNARLTDAATGTPGLTPDVPGTYRVELDVTDPYGLHDTDTVTLVTDGDPTAEAGSDIETSVGSTVTLDGKNSTDPENQSLSYTWETTSRPDGAEATLSDPSNASTSLTPTTPGNYTIELTVTDPQNNTATDTVDVVANAPPTAALDFSPDRPTVDEPIRFDATESTDVDGTIDTYHWDFGANGTIDATTETATINRTYHDTGDQLVRVTVADSDGLNDTTSAVVTVEARGPASPTSLRIDSPTNTSAVRVSEAGRRLTTETVVSYDRPLESVPSQVGDGFDVAIGQTTARASVQDVELTNSTAVTVTLVSAVEDVQPGWRDLHVTLRASPACQPNQACPTVIHTLDDTSPDAIAYKLDEVGNDPPTARLSFAPSNPTTGDWLVFSGFESSDPDGNITSYEWSFDGSESADTIWGVGSGWFTDHHFESAGDHTVSLTVTDDDGASNTISRTIPVVAGADESASVTIANLELQLRNITECGLTCRNVKYELKNPTSSPVSDLTADISINAGGETVLETEQAIGDVAAGETVTLTDRIEINQSQLTTILENDGKVTVAVQLRMGDATRTLTFDREL